MGRWRSAALPIALLAACSTQPTTTPTSKAPLPITPPAEARHAPVARVPAPPPPVAVTPPDAPVRSTTSAPLPVSLPFAANVIYVCVTDDAGQRKQTAIELLPKVLELCRRHPEMGPCQYEREVCRHAGGRVFAADGTEITRRTEEEYDKRVVRVRFRAN